MPVRSAATELIRSHSACISSGVSGGFVLSATVAVSKSRSWANSLLKMPGAALPMPAFTTSR